MSENPKTKEAPSLQERSRKTDHLPEDQPAAETKKMANKEDAHELLCDVQRSVRYHRMRESFFQGWSDAFSFLNLLAGTAVVATILGGTNEFISIGFGALVASIQAVQFVGRIHEKARDHASLAAEFSALERLCALRGRLSAEQLLEVRGEFLAIESREPPAKRWVNAIAHNQVARALGYNEKSHGGEFEKISRWNRLLAHYVSGYRSA